MKGNKKPVDNLNSIDKDEQITVAPSTENSLIFPVFMKILLYFWENL